jgi:hypothetical protein
VIVLRQPPYDSFASYTLEPSTQYYVVIREYDRNVIVFQKSITSNTAGVLSIDWTGTYGENDTPYDFRKYDETYHVEITADGEIAGEDNLTVERPYVDPNTLGETSTDIATAKENERLARAIIDSVVAGGFYFKTSWLEPVGQGTDYMPIWERAYKILKVYENAELVYDTSLEVPGMGEWNYVITKDKTAITKDPNYKILDFNRSESVPVGLNIAASDSISMFDTADSGNTVGLKSGVLFNKGTDYLFYLETGYKVVPYDIQDATKMLINDISCGKLEYFKRYVTDYSTDQFKISIDGAAFAGTGNILVDKILDKYVTNVKKPGML